MNVCIYVFVWFCVCLFNFSANTIDQFKKKSITKKKKLVFNAYSSMTKKINYNYYLKLNNFFINILLKFHFDFDLFLNVRLINDLF
jgi:hypothetical protein